MIWAIPGLAVGSVLLLVFMDKHGRSEHWPEWQFDRRGALALSAGVLGLTAIFAVSVATHQTLAVGLTAGVLALVSEVLLPIALLSETARSPKWDRIVEWALSLLDRPVASWVLTLTVGILLGVIAAVIGVWTALQV